MHNFKLVFLYPFIFFSNRPVYLNNRAIADGSLITSRVVENKMYTLNKPHSFTGNTAVTCSTVSGKTAVSCSSSTVSEKILVSCSSSTVSEISRNEEPKYILTFSEKEWTKSEDILPPNFWNTDGFQGLDDKFVKMMGFDSFA